MWNHIRRTIHRRRQDYDFLSRFYLAFLCDLCVSVVNNMIEKVTAFIIRERDFLLLRHPFAGNQFPAGTVEPGEDHAAAVIREAHEETGLPESALSIVRNLGSRNSPPPEGYAFMDRAATVYARPDPASFDWATLPRATMPKLEGRQANGFTQVTYIEMDCFPNPTFNTYQITGWVRDDALTDQQIRHFYVLSFSGNTLERWTARSDHHAFTLFWAPLDDLPDIIYPQNTWLDALESYDNS
jgi:8-oxo-dGTP pyrophosphatase MutT (NUDIX family)